MKGLPQRKPDLPIAESPQRVSGMRVPSTWQLAEAPEGIAGDAADGALEAEIESLIAARTAARAAKDWATSDRIRDELAARGIELLDGKDGKVTWRRTGVKS